MSGLNALNLVMGFKMWMFVERKMLLKYTVEHLNSWLKANSHMPRRTHAVPLPRRAALFHTGHAVPLPFSDSATSFVKDRVVAGNIRTAGPTV
jgi:hypothetical protein